MKFGVLHICDYAAAYKGGFMNALEFLRRDVEKDGIRQVYLLPHRALSTNAKSWIEDMRRDGAVVYVQTDSFVKNIFLLRKIIKENKIKKIFRHFNDFPMDIITKIVCPKIPVVRFFQCTYNASGLSHKLRTLLYKKDVLVGVSPSVTEKAELSFPDREIETLEHALYFDRLEKVDEFERKDKISCLTMGYNVKVKGIDLTFEAFRRIREERDVHLYVVVASHRDEFEEEIRKTFGEKPEWLTVLPPTENIGTYYHNTDIILSPSRTEGALPFAVFEAMYCGCLAVASDIPQQLTDKVSTVRYFKSEDVDDYVRVLSKAVEDVKKPETDAEREKARKEITSNYSMQVWADNFRKYL
ncbi:MAG: glycosyltransferase family 4 protein [Clostridia bacterium]|nr:glycosyltransferase family 4 protein [Clostridia bacterium]